MGDKTVVVALDSNKAIKIRKWKVKEGMLVSARQVIFVYDLVSELSDNQLKFKSTKVGTVRKILAREDDVVNPGGVLLELEECNHPTVMKDMCAECGADLRKQEQISMNASVPMVHSIPELKVSEEQAQIIGKADENRLICDRKLVLLVDLDQTLIHTTNENIPPNLKDVYHFRLYGQMSPWYHTRIRPRTHQFLEEISKYYELHISTFGARNYAHMIAMFLDPDGKYFSHRILSRDECFNANSKTANLKALFPCGDNMVCIIDDREDVWNFAANLIHVKPYHFFKYTGDINAPPGLVSSENDEAVNFNLPNINKEKKEEEKKSNDKNNLKKQPSCSGVKAKMEVLGESTTDKDTEDETEKKSMPNVVEETKTADDIEKVTEDLFLTEDESDETSLRPTKGEKCEKNRENENEQTVSKCSDNENKPETDLPSQPESQTQDENFADKKKQEVNSQTDDLIEVEDSDDYLMYLEDILKNIHKAYYEEYDRVKKIDDQSGIPDLKVVIPNVKKQVLCGCHLVFSGLVPSHTPLKQSRPYMVAISLGATVSADISPGCTHLVAARPGTAKVNSSRRQKGITIVTPLWLWHCAERWERLDEKLYPLGRGGIANRIPPAHCGSPEHNAETEQYSPALRNRSPSGRFIDSINPLLTLSSEDMRSMDKEVNDLCNEDDDDESESETDERTAKPKTSAKVPAEDSSTSSSEESLSGTGHPKGWGKRKRKADTTTCTETEYDEEFPSVKFRRGEPLPSDLDLGEDSQGTLGSDEVIDDLDDGEWNMMGAALEREFLSGE